MSKSFLLTVIYNISSKVSKKCYYLNNFYLFGHIKPNFYYGLKLYILYLIKSSNFYIHFIVVFIFLLISLKNIFYSY